jgi:hypothetical protein
MLQSGTYVLKATFLGQDEKGEQLWRMEISFLSFIVSVEVEDDGVAYEIFSAPAFDDHNAIMHQVVQKWLKEQADEAMEDEEEP